MEALAYIHCCAAYDEAAGIENDFPEWEFNWKLRSSAWIGLLATVTALSILGTTSDAFAIRSGRYYVSGSSLNVRSCPGGCVVKTIGRGRAVDLTGYTSGPWAQTARGNWVYASLVTGRSRVRNPGCRRVRYYSYHHRPSYARRHGRYYGNRYILGHGSRGSAVRSVQRTLRNYGYYVNVDGYYGRNTAHAVKHFQRNNGLYADGLVGRRTRAALY